MVVGNFENSEIRTEEYEKNGLSLYKDFNNGVMLFVLKGH